MTIATLIIATISILINIVTIILMLPYSNNDYICDMQMKIENIIESLFEMK